MHGFARAKMLTQYFTDVAGVYDSHNSISAV